MSLMLSTARGDGKIALKILQESPLDKKGWNTEDASAEKAQHWVPSRYNIRAKDDQGHLVLWNSLSGAMSVFKPEQRPYVLEMLKKQGFESRKAGLPGYLIERGFLVRKGTDEMRVFRMKFGRQHYQSDRLELFLLPSEDCNFRCTYCYEEFARGTMLPEVRQGVMRMVEQRIEYLNVLQVNWFGGEPLYGWAAMEELGPFLADIAEKHDVAYGSQMTTNGYLLTPDVVDKLFAWKINAFQITIDGAPEDHDCSRPTRDGQGTFSTIFENIKNMAKRPDEFAINLRVNYDKTNYPHLEKFLDMLEKEIRGDSRFRLAFHAVGRWGGDNDDALEVCGADEQRLVAAEMKAAAHERGLHFSTLRDITRMGSQVCYAARPFNMIIGASGKVMKCTIALDTEDHNVVGHLEEDGELVLDPDKMALWTEPAFESDSQCQKCVVLPSCQGISCPLPRINHGVRPCVSTRTGAKAEMIEALKYPQRDVRKRAVIASNQKASGSGQ